MTIYCYKVGETVPIVVKDVIGVSAYVTSKLYCDVAKDVGLVDKFPDAANCKDHLFTVTAICKDGSMYTSYDVIQFEGD